MINLNYIKKIGFGFLCFIAISALVNGQTIPNKLKFNIVFVGNSITHGACLQNPSKESPPTRVFEYLNLHNCEVKIANCGVSGSTTVDWLPSTNTLYPTAVVAADSLYAEGVPLVFSIMLGTNDSAIEGPTGAPVSADQLTVNLETIINSLLVKFPTSRFILHYPTWYSPNTHNGATYLQEGLTRMISYSKSYDKVISDNPTKVFRGDTQAFKYFEKRWKTILTPENGHDGTFYLHPNEKGAVILGEFWAKNILNRMEHLNNKN